MKKMGKNAKESLKVATDKVGLTSPATLSDTTLGEVEESAESGIKKAGNAASQTVKDTQGK